MSELGIWTRIVLAVLATWRITHLLASEDGPADAIVKLRMILGQSLAGRLMDCFYCLSMWVAMPFALFVLRKGAMEIIVMWLAISGAACLLERWGPAQVLMSPAPDLQGEDSDVLRTKTGSS
ncbi:MAG TPA: DUF1360 domain-containing protein [Candidatus Angelobacter sp.]|jgi:hypothetical protein|nr:DUF1360 domain-containing protein [Candidatus Angelobacter sp.]